MHTTTRAVSTAGAASIDLAEICRRAEVPVATARDLVGDRSGLLLATTEALCADRLFPEPATEERLSAEEVLRDLADAHRSYVNVRPERFAAIVQLTSAAIFRHPELLRPLQARQLRARRTVAAHLWRQRARGSVDPERDIAKTASAFVDVAVGIEMCYLLDPSTVVRDLAYAEACRTLGRSA